VTIGKQNLGTPPLCGGGSPCRLGLSASVPDRLMPAAGSAGTTLWRALQSSLVLGISDFPQLRCPLSLALQSFANSIPNRYVSVDRTVKAILLRCLVVY
jgi:hypothetical protein